VEKPNVDGANHRETPKWQASDRGQAETPLPTTNCTLWRSRVNMVENDAFCVFSSGYARVWAAHDRAGTAFALTLGIENPGQF
jgi:hypothetical protein